MVSVNGANTVIPLVQQYNVISASIAAAQQAVAAGAEIQFMHADAQVQGQEMALEAHIPMSSSDSSTILNGLISIWENMQTNLVNQINSIV